MESGVLLCLAETGNGKGRDVDHDMDEREEEKGFVVS